MTAPRKPPRLFFALPVSEDVRENAVRCIADLARAGASVKWVERENLHVTMRYLGPTAPERLPALEEALTRAVAGLPAIDAVFDRLGHFGAARHPSSVWVGIDEGQVALTQLARRLALELAAIGIPAEPRPFQAHLTLGRVRVAKSGGALGEALARSARISWRCRLDRVGLWRSELSAKGPTYTVISERRLLPGA